MQALLPLLARTSVLLKTRYTNPSHYLTALGAYKACLASSCLSVSSRPKVEAYVKDAEAFLAANDVEVPARGAGAPTLGELMLGIGGSTRPSNPHYDDIGPIMDDEERIRRLQGGSGSADTSTAPAAAAPGEQGAAQGNSRAQQQATLQASILEGIQAVYQGMEAIARGTESLERELDAVLAALHAQHQPPSRPPASKKVVASLPRVVLDEASLERIGSDTACPVCTETLSVGDEVQLLPCKHAFHVACVAPWLQQNNSCPVCRKELPTDDHKYEADKERQAEEDADRRGAQNALSHNEFAYI